MPFINPLANAVQVAWSLSGLSGAVEHSRKARESAGLVHTLGDAILPDAQPGGYSDRSFLGIWNGTRLHSYVTYILRWGHGGTNDGTDPVSSGQWMFYPVFNPHLPFTGTPYECKICRDKNGNIIISGGPECVA
jgi:hypothetical protein